MCPRPTVGAPHSLRNAAIREKLSQALFICLMVSMVLCVGLCNCELKKDKYCGYCMRSVLSTVQPSKPNTCFFSFVCNLRHLSKPDFFFVYPWHLYGCKAIFLEVALPEILCVGSLTGLVFFMHELLRDPPTSSSGSESLFSPHFYSHLLGG